MECSSGGDHYPVGRQEMDVEAETTASDIEIGESLLLLLFSELLWGSEAQQTRQALSMLVESTEGGTALAIFCEKEVRELTLLGL